MDFIINHIGIIAIIVAVILLLIFLAAIYRVADIDKALIVTGGKQPVIKVSGGSFVIPIFRKASYFDLCMLTVKADVYSSTNYCRLDCPNSAICFR